MFYSYDSILVEPIQCNRIAVSDAEGLSEKEIVNKILIREFDHYKSDVNCKLKLNTPNQEALSIA